MHARERSDSHDAVNDPPRSAHQTPPPLMLGLQRAAGNRAVAQLVARANSGQSPARAGSGQTPVVQRVRYESLDPEDYGKPPSDLAYQFRINSDPPLSPMLNVATFRMVPRPGGPAPAGAGPVAPVPGPFTRPSTGIGIRGTREGKYKDRQYGTSKSHSETQIIKSDIEPLKAAGHFPRDIVIESVYTERPACRGYFLSGNLMAKGCTTRIERLEDLQKQRRFDPGGGGAFGGFSRREDLEITVYSSFADDAKVEIPKAIFNRTFVIPVRLKHVLELTDRIQAQYEKEYDEEPGDDYDVERFTSFRGLASAKAEALVPDWSDYNFDMTPQDAQMFDSLLEEDVAELDVAHLDSSDQEDYMDL